MIEHAGIPRAIVAYYPGDYRSELAMRTTSDAPITTRAARERLAPQHEHYWRGIDGGLALGYRRGPSVGAWMGRLRLAGRYVKQALGRADDVQRADGTDILDYRQAQSKAIAWAAQRQRIAAGLEPEAEVSRSGYTVAEAMQDYVCDYKARGGKAVATTQTAINAHIEPLLGPIVVGRLTRLKVRDWHRSLANSPARRRSSGSAPTKAPLATPAGDALRARQATANRLLTILKAALNHARNEGKITCSPDAWALVKPFAQADAPRIRYLSADETVRLMNAAEGDFRLLVTAALLTGCRYGELSAMRVGACDVDARTIFIPQSKGGKARHIALTDEGVEFFEERSAGRSAGDPMFSREAVVRQPTKHSQGEVHRAPWGKSDQFRAMAETCRGASIAPAVSFHMLRHTYASRLAMNGAGLQVIAAQLGHSGTRMTERHYAHLAPSYVAEEVRARFGVLGVATNDVATLRLRRAAA